MHAACFVEVAQHQLLLRLTLNATYTYVMLKAHPTSSAHTDRANQCNALHISQGVMIPLICCT